MSRFLFHTFEQQSRKKSKILKLDTVAPKDHERVVGLEHAPRPLANVASRFCTTKRTHSEHDKRETEERHSAGARVQAQDPEVYAHLAEVAPDTLEKEHAYVDPHTGEVIPYRVRVDVSTNTDRIPKARVREIFDQAFRETMREAYPAVELDRPFDPAQHLDLAKRDRFVSSLHDRFATLFQQEQDAHKTYRTSFTVVQVGKGEDV